MTISDINEGVAGFIKHGISVTEVEINESDAKKIYDDMVAISWLNDSIPSYGSFLKDGARFMHQLGSMRIKVRIKEKCPTCGATK